MGSSESTASNASTSSTEAIGANTSNPLNQLTVLGTIYVVAQPTAANVPDKTQGSEEVKVHTRELNKLLDVAMALNAKPESGKSIHSFFQYLIKNKVLSYPEFQGGFTSMVKNKLIEFIQVDDKTLGEDNPSLWVLDTIKQLFPYRPPILTSSLTSASTN